jgi:transcriptional regulator with XRE-family HTH domain
MHFGALVRQWRLDAGLSQRELARRAGMDFTYLSKIETGILAPPDEERIAALVRGLGRSDEDLQQLIDLAQSARVPNEDLKAAIIRNPDVGALLRRVARRPLTSQELRQIQQIASVDIGTPHSRATSKQNDDANSEDEGNAVTPG